MTESAPKDAASAAEADEPGRPRRPDEVDPELIRLPRRRARIGPLLAASVIALCAIMMWRLRGDLAFSRADVPPARLDARGAAAADYEAYVELDGRPDRVTALHVFPSRASDGHRLARVLGASGAVWLLLDGDPWDEAPATRERYVGRVRRLGDLPFFDALTARLADAPPAPVAIDPPALRAALAGGGAGGGALADPSGEAVPVEPATEVTVSETVAGRARVTVSAIETHPDELAWQTALVRAGILPAGVGPVSAGPGSWTFEVPAAAGVDGVAAALVAARLFAASAEPLVIERRARFADLAASADGLALAGATVPWSSVSGLTVAARPPAPSPDARVIVTGESPGDYWFVLPIYLAFAAFVALFAWGLVRALRSTAAAT